MHNVVLPTGVTVQVVAETEKVDGYWSSLRTEVGRSAVNTGAAGSLNRSWLLKLVRVTDGISGAWALIASRSSVRSSRLPGMRRRSSNYCVDVRAMGEIIWFCMSVQ